MCLVCIMCIVKYSLKLPLKSFAIQITFEKYCECSNPVPEW